MPSDTAAQRDTVIACDPFAVPPDRRERWVELAPQLYGSVDEVRELPDGYAFRLPASSLLLAAEDLDMERLCCPFLRYTLEIEPHRGPVWIRMTGDEAARDFLRMSLESARLLDEDVARAAGLDVSAGADVGSVDRAIETAEQVNERFAGRARPGR
jgi:hypothetical protein